jgi:cysteine-rich repeat protein
MAVCGDGFTNPAAGEQCDGGGETLSCDTDCTTRTCGDGTVNVTAGEECDDGNVTPGDGCNATCLCGPGSGEAGCQDALCPNRAAGWFSTPPPRASPA